jgi:rhodanese-related sulfurtransferase
MDIDLNKFRTLIPINALYEDSLLYLADFTQVARYSRGDTPFVIGDTDNDSIFLMSGQIRLTSDSNETIDISSGTDQALYALASRRPRRYQGKILSETATLARVDTHLLEKLLAWGQFAPDVSATDEIHISSDPDPEQSEWMMAMMQTPAFSKLPPANIERLFNCMEEITTEAGEEIVHMGDPGDYFYVIKQGRCRVTYPSESGEAILAELGRCSSFGEQALISNEPRNASVSMITRGKLMRLAKQDFLDLLEAPLLQDVDRETVDQMVRKGAILVDVRYKSEFEHTGLRGAINIPLNRLRATVPKMNKKNKYIFYCDTGQRSSSAAFLMSQIGFDAYVLLGGLSGPVK